MRRAMMIVAMIAVIGMAGTADAYVYLVDIGPVGSVATANDFATAPTGVVPGLTGSEPVDTLAGSGSGTFTTAGGIDVTFGGSQLNYWLGAALGNLRGDMSEPPIGTMNVSIGHVALDPSTLCTLYLWGNITGNSWGSQYNEDSAFTPINNADVTFASTATVEKFLAVNFTTSAAWDDVNSTIDFVWGPGVNARDFLAFNAFAITGPGPIPEPAGLGLIGLALLAVRRRRS